MSRAGGRGSLPPPPLRNPCPAMTSGRCALPGRRLPFPVGIAAGKKMSVERGPGYTGNVIAAIASFFIPGLGQLVQGRLLKALIMFVMAIALWVVFLGWIIHLWSILDAATFRGR